MMAMVIAVVMPPRVEPYVMTTVSLGTWFTSGTFVRIIVLTNSLVIICNT
jgi:hypothetical protein